jgi:hypothetical protein
MRKVALICTLIALTAAPGAIAQTVKFFNFVDEPIEKIRFDAAGNAQVLFNTRTQNEGPILSVAGFKKVHIQFGTTRVKSFQLTMGKMRGTTLAPRVFVEPVDTNIHTFDIVRPDMTLWLMGGPPNQTVTTAQQLWVLVS